MAIIFLKKNKLTIIGLLIGAIGGYLYYSFVGCISGSCGITSNPFNSTAYGAVMGGLILNIFQPKSVDLNDNEQEQMNQRDHTINQNLK